MNHNKNFHLVTVFCCSGHTASFHIIDTCFDMSFVTATVTIIGLICWCTFFKHNCTPFLVKTAFWGHPIYRALITYLPQKNKLLELFSKKIFFSLVRYIIQNPTFAFCTILQALVGRRAISVEYENNFYYFLMTYIMSSDK